MKEVSIDLVERPCVYCGEVIIVSKETCCPCSNPEPTLIIGICPMCKKLNEYEEEL